MTLNHKMNVLPQEELKFDLISQFHHVKFRQMIDGIIIYT